jgi:hypothetical protein
MTPPNPYLTSDEAEASRAKTLAESDEEFSAIAPRQKTPAQAEADRVKRAEQAEIDKKKADAKRGDLKGYLAAVVTKAAELPNRKDLSDVRMEAELNELRAKVKAIEDAGIKLGEPVFLTEAEEVKYPRNEHMKHILLKKLRFLRDKQIFVEKRRNDRETAARSSKRTQELYEMKMAELRLLDAKLKDYEQILGAKNASAQQDF